MNLDLNNDLFHCGDEFILKLVVNNEGPAFFADQYVVLQVGDLFWFWPDWVAYPPGIDYDEATLEPFTRDLRTILEFQWPDITASASNLAFYAVLTDPVTGAALTDLDVVDFGFGN